MSERQRPAAPRLARVILYLVFAMLYLPIIVMLLGAVFHIESGVVTFTLHWIKDVLLDPVLMDALMNSLIVAFFTSLIATVVGALGALALVKSSARVRAWLSGMNFISLIFPEIVFALALLSWFFLLHVQLGYMTVIIAHVSFSLSYVMMTVGARLATLDKAYEDAGQDLGASEWQILNTITVPLLKPAIVGGFILSFLLSFDDFLITYFVNGVGTDTLPIKLYSAMKLGISPKLNALSSMMFLISLIVMIFFFRSSSFRVLFERDGGGTDGQQK
jgi:spermidine/putrescine transport system permease protein